MTLRQFTGLSLIVFFVLGLAASVSLPTIERSFRLTFLEQVLYLFWLVTGTVMSLRFIAKSPTTEYLNFGVLFFSAILLSDAVFPPLMAIQKFGWLNVVALELWPTFLIISATVDLVSPHRTP